MFISSLSKSSIICNSLHCEVHVTLAGVESGWDSTLQCFFMAVCTCILLCDVELHMRKSILWIGQPIQLPIQWTTQLALIPVLRLNLLGFCNCLLYYQTLSEGLLGSDPNPTTEAVANRLGPHKITVGTDILLVTASFGWNKWFAHLSDKPHLLCTRLDVPGSLYEPISVTSYHLHDGGSTHLAAGIALTSCQAEGQPCRWYWTAWEHCFLHASCCSRCMRPVLCTYRPVRLTVILYLQITASELGSSELFGHGQAPF